MAIAAGGTAGHVVPALAVADELRASGADVFFVGAHRAEATLIPPAGYRLHQISVEGISRTNPLRAMRALVKAGIAAASTVRLLRAHKPDVVLGAGGYVSGVVGFAAVVLRIPLVLTEADSHLGLSNRLLGRFAKQICLSFPLAESEQKRFVITGRPVPDVKIDRQQARRRFGIGADDRCVLIFGGSLGARTINLVAPLAFAEASFHVLHVTGRRDFALVKSPNSRYLVRDYVDDFSAALAAADLVVARAGGSVFEVARYRLPMVLIPYPYATGDHQQRNAESVVRAGAAVVISEHELDPERLRHEVERIVDNEALLGQMAEKSGLFAKPNAARDVARIVLNAASC